MNTILTLHDPQTARENYLSGVWHQDTLYSLAREHARIRPNACAVRDPYRRLTWREVIASVDIIAESLFQGGLRRGDRVAVWLPNRIESVLVFLACSRNGYVCCPSLHQNYTNAEIVRLLSRIRCKALFAQPGYGADSDRYSIFEESAAVASIKQLYALAPQGIEPGSSPSPKGTLPFPDHASGMSITSAPVLDPDKVVYLAFTSGTTGEPKGVMHSDNTLLANGRALVTDWKHDSSTIVLALSPMSHHIGTVALEQSLVAGMELVLHYPGANRSALDWVLETGATYVMGVPTHAMDMLAALRERGLSRLGNVNVFYMAGSPIPREVAQRFLDLGVKPQNVYGMTENGSHQYTLPSDHSNTIVSTCGRACKGYEIRIFNQENSDIEAGPGDTGEIGGKGGVLMLGYYDNQDATEQSFNSSGWFLSGDLGRLDENGCLHVMGRKKDLIIRGGHNIYPSRIEDLAHRHPSIVKSAAFPVPDARLGEKVCLAVIFAPGTALDTGQVLKHLHDAGLSKYDMPEYFIAMDAFPLTPSGKILKRDLVAWLKDGKIAPEPVRWKAEQKPDNEGVSA
ncbi:MULTISPECIES: class I adenylate-forming enzyme family protein [Alcaligenaceae]|uniref:Ligase/synthetase n=1 Tax=Bordetella petrii (strain ATCC BAA-461 / DSM 12804 / CCUG 43448 / CIP 107267 / Se-1111R) TaxID=340100 RepID=A9ICJ1_BORPD|nr:MULTISPECIES: class I adenylate-forming enzyme family protein [Alcaligenaceae]CAP41573.1 putative ligase/synthetase [Bordetella petrii]CUJ31441.1 Short-chain-fatty-acid--CoA ligase [Achromobacter xylosoxidans]CUJ71515.1 Short-chain-fatty-acid--CoA ligase [Achromobacter xylosoxidans]